MKKPIQLSMLQPQHKFFGGALLQQKRKSIRPLSSKDSIHLVMRSDWASGSYSFLNSKNKLLIDLIISKFAKKFGITIYQRAINSNHIHLLLQVTNRTLYRKFIKAVSGQIASAVMQTNSFIEFLDLMKERKRGDGSKSTQCGLAVKSKSFWQFRPFSRVVSWGKDFNTCAKYIKQNVFEALGFISYKLRKDFYSRPLIQNLKPRKSPDPSQRPFTNLIDLLKSAKRHST